MSMSTATVIDTLDQMDLLELDTEGPWRGSSPDERVGCDRGPVESESRLGPHGIMSRRRGTQYSKKRVSTLHAVRARSDTKCRESM